MALTEYQKFVKKNASKYKLKNGMVDLKTIGRLWREKKGGSTKKPKAKPKVKPRSVSTTSSKPKPRSRSKGELERKRIAFKKEFDDIARALGVPLAKTTFKIVKNSWSLKAGKVKAKNVKLSKAMSLFKRRARKRL